MRHERHGKGTVAEGKRSKQDDQLTPEAKKGGPVMGGLPYRKKERERERVGQGERERERERERDVCVCVFSSEAGALNLSTLSPFDLHRKGCATAQGEGYCNPSLKPAETKKEETSGRIVVSIACRIQTMSFAL